MTAQVHAMYGERRDFAPADKQHGGHVAEWDDGENKEDYAYSAVVCGQHQGEHGQSSCDVPCSLETEPRASVSIGAGGLRPKPSTIRSGAAT